MTFDEWWNRCGALWGGDAYGLAEKAWLFAQNQQVAPAIKDEPWCSKCKTYHDDLRPNGPLEICPHAEQSAAAEDGGKK